MRNKHVKKWVNIFLVMLVMILLVVRLVPGVFDEIMVRSWHIVFDDQVQFDDLRFAVPRNWMAVKSRDDIKFLRSPSESGMISIGLSSDSITEEMVQTRPLLSDDNGNLVKYENVQRILLSEALGFTAFTVLDGKYRAMVSFPAKEIFGVFEGNGDGFEEFHQIITNAVFVERA